MTTWPAFTEAMYLLGRRGTRAQETLWKLVDSARLVLAELSPAAIARSARLMTQYADQPMDLADATLVALAEERGDRRIFTLDAHFQVYRLRGRQRFEHDSATVNETADAITLRCTDAPKTPRRA